MYNPDMVCFCDIPVQDFSIHQKKYSKFGISFLKSFLITKGVTPVFYLPKNAIFSQGVSWGDYVDKKLRKHMGKFLEIRNLLKTKESPLLDTFKAVHSFLDWRIFSFMKFYEEGLQDDHTENFYMEREWRRVGSLKFKISDVSRIILPAEYSARFRRDVPRYKGQLSFAG